MSWLRERLAEDLATGRVELPPELLKALEPGDNTPEKELLPYLPMIKALPSAAPQETPLQWLEEQEVFEQRFRKLAQASGMTLEAYVKKALAEQIAPSKKAVPRIPRTTPPFDANGNAVVGNNPPCHVLFEAVSKGGPNARNKKNGWQDSSVNQEQAIFKTPQRVKGDWTVFFDNALTGSWERVEGLSALHTKLGLFAFAKICDPRNEMRHPSKEPVGVSYEDLRRALGLREMSIEKFKPLADRLVRDWADLKATVRGIMINGKPDGIAECSLFVISKVWDKQFAFFEERQQIGWLFDPGPWAKHYFNSDAKPWLSTLQKTVLELDHRGVMRADVLALHIATLLFVVAGGDHFQKQAITKTVEELLELAGELPEPEHRGRNWAHRTRERLETALDTLQAQKLAALIEYGPNYPGGAEAGKGWVEDWLSATITLTSPEAAAFLGRDVPEQAAKLPARLERKQKTVKAQPRERLDDTTAARLRAGIAHHFMNQTQAARHFGCSQSALSRAANGINAPKPELAAKIREFLDSLDSE